MSAAINSALNVRGSNFSLLPSLRNLHHRDAQARHPEDRASFDELIAPHVQKIFRVAYRITQNREDAEDAVQDAFLQAFAHFEDFDGRSTFATWLTRIAINSSLMILRKRKYEMTVSLEGAGDSEEPKALQEVRDPAPDAEQRYLQKEREVTIRGAVKALRASLRSVVELHHFGERSMRETAEIIGLSVCATKARLFHARAALRKSRKICRLRNDQPVLGSGLGRNP
jgi:RNA polymerase sigma-70 factor (ECF subfamily)